MIVLAIVILVAVIPAVMLANVVGEHLARERIRQIPRPVFPEERRGSRTADPTDSFPVDAPCPGCGLMTVRGYPIYSSSTLNPFDVIGDHTGTRYVCTAPGCPWEDWVMPGYSPTIERDRKPE